MCWKLPVHPRENQDRPSYSHHSCCGTKSHILQPFLACTTWWNKGTGKCDSTIITVCYSAAPSYGKGPLPPRGEWRGARSNISYLKPQGNHPYSWQKSFAFVGKVLGGPTIVSARRATTKENFLSNMVVPISYSFTSCFRLEELTAWWLYSRMNK